MNQPPEPETQLPASGSMLRGLVLASTLISALGVGAVAGYALDRHFNTKPLLTAILTLVGLGLGLYRVIREVLR